MRPAIAILLMTAAVALGACDDCIVAYQLNEHYLVIDFSVDGKCSPKIQMFYEGRRLIFDRPWGCYGFCQDVICPSFLFATNHDWCTGEDMYNCRGIDRGFTWTLPCRLLVDVDAVKAHYDTRSYFEQVRDQPREPFHLQLEFREPSVNACGTLDGTFLPHTFDMFKECHNEGWYRDENFDQMYECIRTMPAHATVNIEGSYWNVCPEK